jgi:subfamily B ATP-binding cassette protein MsbA
MLGLAAPYRRMLTVSGILTAVSSAISLSVPLVTRGALDHVLKTRHAADLSRLALVMIALFVLSAITSYAQYMLMAYAGNRVVLDLRRRLFAHLLTLPVTYFDSARSGDLTSRLSNDVSLVQQSLTEDLVRMVSNVAMLVGGTCLAAIIDWRLTGVVVGLLGAMIGILLFFGRRLRRITRQSLDALSEAMGMITEALANIRLVKAFAREEYETGRADARLEQVFRIGMRSSALEGALGTVAFSGFIAVLLGVVWYGGSRVLNGTSTVGSLLAFLMTIVIISGPMASLAGQYSRLNRAAGATDRLFAMLDDASETADPPGAVGFPAGSGRVEFCDVEFAYAPEVPVLQGLSLEMRPGEVTALVGASGAGKSTLASLLYRFYEPAAGEIRIDGVDIRQIARRSLRDHIGIVPQEPVLFNGTIRENIRYGWLDATNEEVEHAAQVANAAEFITRLPEGYDTVLGERGVTLSGGQRQRVAIARAVLKDPRILLLDEATSSLDVRSEALVRDALETLMQGRTTLVIAHRLSTIRTADQIAMIEHGRIVEEGRHEELILLDGRYAALQAVGSESRISTDYLEG